MIVDDEQDLREMINLMMAKEGYETEMAQDGIDFLKKNDNFQPDIVTLDVMMD
jgi:two-component system response regulator MprA